MKKSGLILAFGGFVFSASVCPAGPEPMAGAIGSLGAADVAERRRAEDALQEFLRDAEREGDREALSAVMAALRRARQSADPEVQAVAQRLLGSYLAEGEIWRVPVDLFARQPFIFQVSGREALVAGFQAPLIKNGKREGCLWWFACHALDDGKQVWKRTGVFLPLGIVHAASFDGENLVAAGKVSPTEPGPPLVVCCGPDQRGIMNPPPRWQREVGDAGTVVSLSVGGGRMVIASLGKMDPAVMMTGQMPSSSLEVWNAKDGKPLWKTGLPDVTLTGAEVASGRLLAWGVEGRKETGWVGFFDLETGRPAGSSALAGTTIVSHAVMQGEAVALTGGSPEGEWSGTLVQENAGEGKLVDRRGISNAFARGETLGPRERLVAPTARGCLIASIRGKWLGLFRTCDADAPVREGHSQ